VNEFDLSLRSEAITGVASVNNKLVIMMDAAKLLDSQDMVDLTKALST
jgi:chemotaxis signal transduction protein